MSRVYTTLARHLPDPRLLFLNYGLHDPAMPAEPLHDEDRPYRHHFDLVRRALGDTPLRGARVLDVGCGRGGNAYYVVRYREPAATVGVEPFMPNLALAGRARAAGATLLCGRAEALPLRDASCDVVLSIEAAHCYGDFGRFLEETARVLRPDGALCLVDVWDLDVLGLDWPARQRALEHGPLRAMHDEDVSEQVFLALAREDGLPFSLRQLANTSNRDVVERLVRDTEAFRAGLASGACSYRCLRLRRK